MCFLLLDMFDQGGSCGRTGLVRILRPIRRPYPTPVQLDILPTNSVSVLYTCTCIDKPLLYQSGDPTGVSSVLAGHIPTLE